MALADYAAIVVVALAWLAIALALYDFERAPVVLYRRRQPQPHISISILLLAFAAVLLLDGSLVRSSAITLCLLIAIGAVSRVKARHTGFNLVADDVIHVFDGAAQFLLKEYWQTALAFFLGLIALGGCLTMVALYVPPAPVPVLLRVGLLAAAALATFLSLRAVAGRDWFGPLLYTANHSHFSGFIASIALRSAPQVGLRMQDVAREPLPLPAQALRSSERPVLPDIFVIQHESTFDPQIYGLPISDRIQKFLFPKGALSGHLKVDTFGGHSWITEFAFLTGLSALSFGANSRYIYHKGENRFRHTLPLYLRSLGYDTALMTPTARTFLNYDRFYESIGVSDRVFTKELGPPFDHPDLQQASSDALFFDAALAHLDGRIGEEPPPLFMMLLTGFNHGPHTRRRLKSQLSDKARRFALKGFADQEYGEFYARLVFSANSYAAFRDALRRKFPNRPMLIVRYGDHQPKLVRNILAAQKIPGDDPRMYQTFYAIEGINQKIDTSTARPEGVLDMAFLSSVALRAAGVPLDPIRLLHHSLIEECGGGYFESSSARKAGFHRTLIHLGLLDVTTEPAS